MIPGFVQVKKLRGGDRSRSMNVTVGWRTSGAARPHVCIYIGRMLAETTSFLKAKEKAAVFYSAAENKVLIAPLAKANDPHAYHIGGTGGTIQVNVPLDHVQGLAAQTAERVEHEYRPGVGLIVTLPAWAIDKAAQRARASADAVRRGMAA